MALQYNLSQGVFYRQ